MEDGKAVLMFHPWSYFTPKLVSYKLHAVADAQHRETAFVNIG